MKDNGSFPVESFSKNTGPLPSLSTSVFYSRDIPCFRGVLLQCFCSFPPCSATQKALADINMPTVMIHVINPSVINKH